MNTTTDIIVAQGHIFSKKSQLRDTTKKPITLDVIIENIPQNLRDFPWVIWEWRLKSKKNGATEWAKVPCRCVMGFPPASSTDPKAWSTFAEAVDFYQRFGHTRVDGIGVILTNGLCGVDLDDDCPDRDCLVTTFGTYAERSPTGGRGYKVFGLAKCPGPDHKSSDACEVYDGGRYFAVTRHHVEGTPTTIEPFQGPLDSFYESRIRKPKQSAEKAAPVVISLPPLDVDDQTIIDIASDVLNEDRGLAFRRLWSGDWSGYQSQSEADAALVSRLAYYCDDLETVDRLFRQSGLFRDDKWERANYRNRTLERYGQPEQRYDWWTFWCRLFVDQQIVPLWPDETNDDKCRRVGLIRWNDLRAIAATQQDRWIIQDIVEPGTSTVFSGLPYAGKTRILTHMMGCVATSRPFLGHEIKQRCPILYLNCDRLKERHIVKRISTAFLDPLDESKLAEVFFTLSLPKIPLTVTPTFLEELIGTIKDAMDDLDTTTGILICDPMRSAYMQELKSGSEYDPTEMTRVMNPIRSLSSQTDWALFTPHHNSKGRNEHSGTAAIAGCTDALWNVKRDDGSHISKLLIQNRDGQIPSIDIIENENGLERVDAQEAKRKAAEAEEAVLVSKINMFPTTAADGLTLSEMVKRGICTNRTAAQRFVAVAGRAGIEPRLESYGTGTKGDAYRWYRV